MWLLLFQDRGGAFLYSLFVGILIGVIYDVFRVLRVIFGQGKVKVFFEDILFCLMSALVLCVFIFNATLGMIRLFAFCGVAFGFFAHYITVGRLTIGAARALKALVKPPIERLGDKAAEVLERFREGRRSAALKREVIRKARRGFA